MNCVQQFPSITLGPPRWALAQPNQTFWKEMIDNVLFITKEMHLGWNQQPTTAPHTEIHSQPQAEFANEWEILSIRGKNAFSEYLTDNRTVCLGFFFFQWNYPWKHFFGLVQRICPTPLRSPPSLLTPGIPSSCCSCSAARGVQTLTKCRFRKFCALGAEYWPHWGQI